MDGMHDLGGKQGFGKVRYTLDATAFHATSNAATREAFKPGDRVRVREESVPGHMRLPGYIRGKVGVVVGVSPPYPFPDAHAHGIAAEDEPTYDVQFRTEDLWPGSSDSARVHAGVFESYLERVT